MTRDVCVRPRQHEAEGVKKTCGRVGRLASGVLMRILSAAVLFGLSPMAQNTPVITLVANASRLWQSSDFVNNQMPTNLDGVSVTVNGKSAFVYYISATQINVLTPPDALPASVQVVVTNGNNPSPPFSVEAQAMSPSFFIFDVARHIAATHADGSLLGPANLFPGASTPAKPGKTVVLYANGFGPTSAVVVSGSATQSGTLSPLPEITVGGAKASVTFAGLVMPGEFQFNVVLPSNVPNGDNPVVATYQWHECVAGLVPHGAGSGRASSGPDVVCRS